MRYRPIPALLMALSICLLTGCRREIKRSRIDILFITVDTLRADHLGAYGYDFISTPNIDRLAADGALFEHVRTAVPLTLPSHTTIFTGLYPPAHGVRDNGNYIASEKLVTMAEVLKDAGYSTAAVVGSFVLDKRFGLNQGFDFYDDSGMNGNPEGGIFCYPERKAEKVTDRAIWWLKSFYGIGEGSGQAARALKKGGEKRFFMWVHYFDPHAVYNPPPPFDKKYGDHLYDGEIAYTDEQIGRLITEIYKIRGNKGLLIVLTADHGESLNQHGEMTHGVFIYDSTMHVPLIINAPGLIRPARIPWAVSTSDIMPTVLDIIGIKSMPPMQGTSMVGMLEGKGKDGTVYMETVYPRTHFGWSELRALAADGYTMIESPRPELYEWKDEGQERDLAAEKPSLVDSYIKRLHVLLRDKLRNPAMAESSKGKMTPEIKRKLLSLGYVVDESKTDETLDMEPISGINPADKRYFQMSLSKATYSASTGDYENAIRIYLELLEKDPKNLYLLNNIGGVYRMQGEMGKAREYFLKVLEIDPRNSVALTNLGGVESDAGNYVKARDYLIKEIEFYPGDVESYVMLGKVEIKLGENDKAFEMFNEALRIDPEDPQTRVVIGMFMMESGKPEDAARHFKAALNYSPDDLAVLSLLGKVDFEICDREGALAAYGRAAELSPGSAEDQFNYALALETGNDCKTLLGPGSDPSKAAEYYSRALRINPEIPMAAERLHAIRRALETR